MRVTVLNSVVCEELTEQVSLRSRLKGDERVSHVGIWRKNDPGKGKNNLKNLGGSMPGMLKTHTRKKKKNQPQKTHSRSSV